MSRRVSFPHLQLDSRPLQNRAIFVLASTCHDSLAKFHIPRLQKPQRFALDYIDSFDLMVIKIIESSPILLLKKLCRVE